jgi:peptidoglycan-associated lipoprotein
VSKYLKFTALIMLVLALALSAGCAKKPGGVSGSDPAASGDLTTGGQGTGSTLESDLSDEERARLERERQLKIAKIQEEQALQEEAKLREVFINQDIHFDYDRWDLSAEAKQILNDKAAYMLSHPELRVIVEGHCDERGSNSYNMALGEKRARSVAAYLEAMGVSLDRMESVSYGEEKPKVFGHTEDSYAANRRAHFIIK